MEFNSDTHCLAVDYNKIYFHSVIACKHLKTTVEYTKKQINEESLETKASL